MTTEEQMTREEQICRDALSEFGFWHQLLKCVEECSELQKECCKRMQGQMNNERLAEEIADVEITIQQIKIAFGLSNEASYWKGIKMTRLEKIIEARRTPKLPEEC